MPLVATIYLPKVASVLAAKTAVPLGCELVLAWGEVCAGVSVGKSDGSWAMVWSGLKLVCVF